MVSQKKKQKNNFELNRFLRKLNTLACTLDLSSSNTDIVEVLWALVVFIDKWNQEFFNKMAVQLDLVIFMSRLMNKTIIENQIQILTMRYPPPYLATKTSSRSSSLPKSTRSPPGKSPASRSDSSSTTPSRRCPGRRRFGDRCWRKTSCCFRTTTRRRLSGSRC